VKQAAVLMLCALAADAFAGQRSDYAQEWPLRLAREDGGAFRVVLSEAMYRAAHDPGLADIEVFNAAGESLPATLLGPEGASAQEWPRQDIAVPWFKLPPDNPDDTDADWNLRAERDDRGRVMRVDATVQDGTGAPVSRDLLLDLSQIETPLAALRLDWRSDIEPFQNTIVLSGSDDLRHWNRIADGVVADLRNGEERLRRNRVELGRKRSFRYLRIAAVAPATLPAFSAVHAEAAPPPPEPEWRWISIAGQEQRDGEHVSYRYRVDARIPARQLDVRANAGNSVANWTVLSRDDTRQPWLTRAGPWTGYRVASGDSVESSTPQLLAGSVRDRHWRVDAVPLPNAPPVLVLGYRPEVLVFLAQGEGPYTIAAGSANARRRDAPIATLLDALRRRHGADWKPYPALPEGGRVLGGDAALVAAPEPARPQDWRSLLLWIVLVAGTLLVVAMALRLLSAQKDSKP
jgi:hypothetical protein